VCVAYVPSVELTSVDYKPVACHPSSRAHGRVDAVVLVAKVALCILFACHHDVKRSLLEAAVSLFSVLYFYGYLVYLPYYDLMTNKLHGMIGSVLLWASMCLVLRHLRDSSSDTQPSTVSVPTCLKGGVCV
jgi:hypothetical protein